MPHVSKKKLKTSVLRSIHRRFSKTVLQLKDTQHGRAFLDNLLTDTEKLMLAKRLAIIFMLNEGISTYHIHQTLKVSVSTVVRISRVLDRGGYLAVVQLFKKKKIAQEFWHDVEKLIRFGMPPYAGKGRWAWLYELDKKYK